MAADSASTDNFARMLNIDQCLRTRIVCSQRFDNSGSVYFLGKVLIVDESMHVHVVNVSRCKSWVYSSLPLHQQVESVEVIVERALPFSERRLTHVHTLRRGAQHII